jgi:hypothetical protein
MGSLPKSISPEICDSCDRSAKDLVTHIGDRLCASCRAVFWTAETLFDNEISGQDEIIATLVYAAWKGRPWDLKKDTELQRNLMREFPRQHQEFDLLRIVDGVPILRLKTMTVSVLRYEETDILQRVQISVLSHFAGPETLAELYEQVLRDEGISWERSNGGAMEWNAINNRLSITIAPTETYDADTVPHLARTARDLWPSFPPPELVREICRPLIGSADKRTFHGFVSYSGKRYLGEHGRPSTQAKEPKTLIPACAAWLIGERKQRLRERAKERRVHISGVLNRHLLAPLEMPELPETSWSPGDTVWRDADRLTDSLGRVSYFLQMGSVG